ncbi:MAG: HigA family addiction module antitoxin [Chloroflexi bacterium]|nr:HigA family addiction module antitoxin [Chloroflexota bacterium]
MPSKDFPPLHPGEVLLEEFLKPMQLSQHALALARRVSPQKINDIVRGKCGVSGDTALRLASALGTTPEFWMGLQSDYELEVAADALGSRLQTEVTAVRPISS